LVILEWLDLKNPPAPQHPDCSAPTF
jgi:hypothetical protein